MSDHLDIVQAWQGHNQKRSDVLVMQHVLADPAWAEAVQPPKAASGKKRSAAAVQDEDTLRKAVKKAKPAAVKPAKPASKPSTKVRCCTALPQHAPCMCELSCQCLLLLG